MGDALGSLPDWLAIGLTLVGLVGGTAGGGAIAAVARSRLDDRRLALRLLSGDRSVVDVELIERLVDMHRTPEDHPQASAPDPRLLEVGLEPFEPPSDDRRIREGQLDETRTYLVRLDSHMKLCRVASTLPWVDRALVAELLASAYDDMMNRDMLYLYGSRALNDEYRTEKTDVVPYDESLPHRLRMKRSAVDVVRGSVLDEPLAGQRFWPAPDAQNREREALLRLSEYLLHRVNPSGASRFVTARIRIGTRWRWRWVRWRSPLVSRIRFHEAEVVPRP